MKKVLVVDDHEEKYYLLQVLLESNQYESTWVLNGSEALATARITPPDLIISDILMPVMDGFALCRAWTADENLKQIPFVFYSATYTEEADRLFAMSLGAAGFIKKPIEVEHFFYELQEIIDRFKTDELIAKPASVGDDSSYYRMYNTVLVNKLERKAADLEQNNQALKQSEADYKYLFENNPLAMWIYDLETLNFLRVNDSAIEIYGYTRDEFMQMNLKNIRPESEVPALLENIEENKSGFQQSGPWQHQLKDGSIIFVDITSHSIVFKGKPARFVVSQDITERKTAEDALRIQMTAMNSAANSIIIAEADGTIVWVNAAFEALTGYSQAEIIGKKPNELEFAGNQDREVGKKMWDTILAGNVWHGERVNQRKDKTFYYEEISITPVQDIKGVISNFVIIVQDVSQRKLTEKLLLESEERLRLALFAANQGMYDVDLKTGSVIVNGMYAQMLGYDPDTFIETVDGWLGRLHPDEREPIETIYNAYVSGEIPDYRVEFRLKMQNGDWKWILSLGSIVERDKKGRPIRLLGTHTDISEIKQTELEKAHLLQESERRLHRISVLHQIDSAISANLTLESTLEVLLEQARVQLGVDAALVLLYNETEQELYYGASKGFYTDFAATVRIKLGQGMIGKAALTNDMVIMPDLNTDDVDPSFTPVIKQENIKAYFGLPLIVKGKLLGALELVHRAPMTIDSEWLDFYKTLGGQAAVAIENAQLLEGLQHANEEMVKSYDSAIEGWSMAMDLRDQETEGHTLRVTECALALARLLNYSDEELVHVRRGSLLHDIGKMGIPDSILLKPDTLTDEERKIIQKHPKYAYDMLQSNIYLRPALDIPYCHHEKWDGTGYPNGLKGEAIPRMARLFAVVDVYDALTSDRPYRPAWSKKEALDYIEAESGTHFDPEVVKVFLKYIQTIP